MSAGLTGALLAPVLIETTVADLKTWDKTKTLTTKGSYHWLVIAELFTRLQFYQ